MKKEKYMSYQENRIQALPLVDILEIQLFDILLLIEGHNEK